MKKIFTLLAVLATALGMSAADWYLVGANYGWADNDAYKFVDNQLTVASLSGEIKIKEAGTWNTSFGSNGSTLQEGVEYAASTDGQNIKVAGIIENATITINPEAHTILVKGKSADNEYTSVYLIGDLGNGWSEDVADGIELKDAGDDTYKADFSLTAEKNYVKFKAGANVYGTGGEDIIVEMGESYTTVQSGNAYVLGAGTYSLTLVLAKNADQGVFTVTGNGVVPDPQPEVVAIAGAFNEWNTTANATTEFVDNCAVITVKNYTNGEGEGAGFKVVYAGKWYGGAAVVNGEWVELSDASDAANIDLAAAEGKDVTFTFAIDNKNLKVEWSEGSPEGALYINSFSIKPGTEKEVEVNIDTPDYLITAFQFDMTLPEGLSVEEEDGEYIFDLTDRAPKRSGHQVNSNTLPDGKIRVVCYSSKSVEFTGNDGAILTFNFIANDSFKGGEILLSKIEVVEKDGTKHILDNYTVKATTSAVEMVNAENAPAVYYNLQGVRVANPTHGIYVKVQGGKATKVAVK